MDNRHLIQMCREFYTNAGNRVRYCRTLVGELGLSYTDIQSTEVISSLHDSEASILRKKIVKAVSAKVRHLICELAQEKRLIEIGIPLPVVGRWRTPRTLLAISTNGTFKVPKSQDGSTKGTTQWDPLENPEFINMLA